MPSVLRIISSDEFTEIATGVFEVDIGVAPHGTLLVAIGIQYWTSTSVEDPGGLSIIPEGPYALGPTFAGGAYWSDGPTTAFDLNVVSTTHDKIGRLVVTSGLWNSGNSADARVVLSNESSSGDTVLGYPVLVLVEGANTGQVLNPTTPYEENGGVEFNPTDILPLATASGQSADTPIAGLWLEVFAHILAYLVTTDDVWQIDTPGMAPITDHYLLKYNGASDYWVVDTADGGTTSPAGTWTDDDSFSVPEHSSHLPLGASFPIQVWQDDTIPLDPEPEPPGGEGAEAGRFRFTQTWATLGPLLLTEPDVAADLLERHDQELEQDFVDHGCGEFLYTFRWPTFHREFLNGDPRAVDVLERRDQELEDASLHQGEGDGQTNDGSCRIMLTHRWREIADLVRSRDARAWDLLVMRDREIEEGRDLCGCATGGGGGGS